MSSCDANAKKGHSQTSKTIAQGLFHRKERESKPEQCSHHFTKEGNKNITVECLNKPFMTLSSWRSFLDKWGLTRPVLFRLRVWLPRGETFLWNYNTRMQRTEQCGVGRLRMGRVVFHKRKTCNQETWLLAYATWCCMFDIFSSQVFQKLEPNFIHYFLVQENFVLAIQVLCKAQHAECLNKPFMTLSSWRSVLDKWGLTRPVLFSPI